MKAEQADIVWTPINDGMHPGDVRVETHCSAWSRTGGDLWLSAARLEGDSQIEEEISSIKQKLALFVNFHTLVVRDGIDPLKAHKAFLSIDEYRVTISREIFGAED